MCKVIYTYILALVLTYFIVRHTHALISTYICIFHSLFLQLENDLREIETSFLVISFYSEKKFSSRLKKEKNYFLKLVHLENLKRKALVKRSQHLNTTDPNIVGPAFASSGQAIATLLGETCCTHLATLLQHVTTCCELKIELVHMYRRSVNWNCLKDNGKFVGPFH